MKKLLGVGANDLHLSDKTCGQCQKKFSTYAAKVCHLELVHKVVLNEGEGKQDDGV